MPDAQTGRRLLIIKDSYAHCFAPFTYGYFDEVDMLDPRYYNASVSELIAGKDYTDVLFLFNAAGFAEEGAVFKPLQSVSASIIHFPEDQPVCRGCLSCRCAVFCVQYVLHRVRFSLAEADLEECAC